MIRFVDKLTCFFDTFVVWRVVIPVIRTFIDLDNADFTGARDTIDGFATLAGPHYSYAEISAAI